ncbi:IucA/IucC family C-terminal-domain containing protein [Glycomyces buryatensis]|uniref:IucA/IucC family C-terminal-domain containing protein n=1 Tax=Glycomyces buryatensis TaxID=2570927 RepID=UPI001FE9284D|nr:IucA/IucC family C-terminal-domain containing protein [Glycomyces buryatensis]
MSSPSPRWPSPPRPADSATGRPIAAALAGDDLDRWWQALVPVLMAPLRLLDRTGIALEAHGQNSLVICKGDRPDSLMYRDFGGIRLPRTGWPQLAGDLQTDDGPERTRKLIAALFPTTLTALVDALATWTGTDPGQWWAPVADAARQACAPGDLADAVLKADWPLKATTAMRLADNPTKDIWVTAPNPLAPL